MSDESLSKGELVALLSEDRKEKFERRKRWILEDVGEMQIGTDEAGSLLHLDAIRAVVRVVKHYFQEVERNRKVSIKDYYPLMGESDV